MPRPTSTLELVGRLRDPATDDKERVALQVLANKMVSIFYERKSHDHIHDVAELALVLSNEGYQKLVWAFIAAIENATTNDGIIPPDLCEGFCQVLERCLYFKTSIDISTNVADLRLGPALQSLSVALTRAVQQNELETQCQLVITLAKVLDAMNSTKRRGLSREYIHKPLLKLLHKIGNDKTKEIRLIQAARYAHQALLGVPNDESPIRALLRVSGTILQGAGKVVGSVSTMDPSKLIDGVVKLQDIPELVASMIEIVKSVSEAGEGVGKSLDLRRKPRQWYMALRYADILIRDGAFKKLTEFIWDVPCRQKSDFVSGIYAQLERAWTYATRADSSSDLGLVRKAILTVLEQPSLQDCSFRKHAYLGTWRAAISTTTGMDAVQADQDPEESILDRFKPHRAFSDQVGCPVHSDQRPSSELLSDSWLDSTEAHLFYADLQLRQCYHMEKSHLLRIQRVSGETLPMEHCFVNLAIVEKKDAALETQMSAETAQYSFASRYQFHQANDKRHLQLGSLFKPQDNAKRDKTIHRRLLIRGRAGVGKTTLCKKIVHELTQTSVHEDFQAWTQRYDRVLWFPLRNLSKIRIGNQSKFELKDLIEAEFFESKPSDYHTLSSCLDHHCSMKGGGRTLFLLDGLDEVSTQLDPDHEMNSFLTWLLNRPDVIITCRPGCGLPVTMNSVDMELETIGFNINQLRTYVQNVARVPEQVQDIQMFLYSRPALLGLFCIPVQLDALCYTWDDFSSSSDPTEAGEPLTNPADLNSMTAIYRAVENRLWRKDIARLGKCFNDGKKITPSKATKLRSDIQARGFVRNEIEFLQCLSFAGLLDNVINFEPRHCDSVHDHLNLSLEGGLLDDMLANLSFLRVSDAPNLSESGHRPPSSAQKHTYHFLHLTYQEYFAALYFAKHWVKQAGISCPAFSGHIRQRIVNTTELLYKTKYNQRYRVFWQFVAGLLAADGSERIINGIPLHDATSPLQRFFQSLEEGPRDMLGPAHQRLIIHCMSEADPLQNNSLFNAQRNNLKQWMLFQARLNTGAELVCEPGFPHGVYDAVIDDEGHDEIIKSNIIRSLCFRNSMISSSTLQNFFQMSWDDDVSNFVEVLADQSILPSAIIRALVALLRKNDDNSLRKIVFVLCRHLDDAIPEILPLFADPDPVTRCNAVKVFIASSNFRNFMYPDSLSSVLVTLMDDNSNDISESAVAALLSQRTLSKLVEDAMTSRLQNPNEAIRFTTTSNFISASTKYSCDILSRTIIATLVDLLRDPCRNVAYNAAILLGDHQTEFTDEDILTIGTLLRSPNKADWSVATRALLHTVVDLPPAILDVLHARMLDKDTSPDLLCGTLNSLTNQRVSDGCLDTLFRIAHTNQPKSFSSRAAFVLCCMATRVPQSYLQELARFLGHASEKVQWAARVSFKNRNDLPDDILLSLIPHIVNNVSDQGYAIMRIFEQQPRLSQCVVGALISEFCSAADYQKNRLDAMERFYYASILTHHLDSLSEADIQRLVALYMQLSTSFVPREDEKYRGRELMPLAKIFNHSTLPPEVTRLALEQLCSHGVLPKAATTILKHQHSLDESVLLDLAGLLQKKDIDVRVEAYCILGKQKKLRLSILLAMTKVPLERFIAELGNEACYSSITRLLGTPGDELYNHMVQDKHLTRCLLKNLLWFSRTENVVLYEENTTDYVMSLPNGVTQRFPKAGISDVVESFVKKWSP